MATTPISAPVRVSGTALEGVRADARRALPGECCGALLGAAPHALDLALPLPNQARQAGAYLVGAECVRVAEAAAAAAGLEVVGFYHSHPGSAAVPSRADVEAGWPWYTYLLVDARTGAARAWTLAEDRSTFVERELLVTEGR